MFAADLTPLLQVAARPEVAVGIHIGQHPGSATPGVRNHALQRAGGVEDPGFSGLFRIENRADSPLSLGPAQSQIQLPLMIGVEKLIGDSPDVRFRGQRFALSRPE